VNSSLRAAWISVSITSMNRSVASLDCAD